MIYFDYRVGFILVIVKDLIWVYGRIYFGNRFGFIVVIMLDLFWI